MGGKRQMPQWRRRKAEEEEERGVATTPQAVALGQEAVDSPALHFQQGGVLWTGHCDSQIPTTHTGQWDQDSLTVGEHNTGRKGDSQ